MTRSPAEVMVELAARCEAATGPDYALDFDIAHAVEWAPIGCKYENACTHWYGKDRAFGLPAFTASLDAALTLVPEGWRYAGSETRNGDWYAHLITRALSSDHCTYEHAETTAATGPLSICAAALRARALTHEAE